MKNLIYILILVFLTACGSSGGGGYAQDPIAPNDPQDQIFEYRLIANGVAGTSFSSTAYRDFGGADQAQTNWNYTLTASQTENIAVYGRTIYWQVNKTGGGNLNVIITKDGVEVQNVTITNNGQTEILTEGI